MIGLAEEHIFGLVTAYDWDASGSPTKVKICTPGEVDYFVVDNEKGKALLDHLRTRVAVRGRILRFNSMQVIDVEEISNNFQGEST
jgi:hypothetical protein